ncbi:MAG: DUF3365 domain-containing protein [Deltaproteobacteria bacterium]|nr:DUF3365 domain-containing protein [Deltaproteobacteria bacterium]
MTGKIRLRFMLTGSVCLLAAAAVRLSAGEAWLPTDAPDDLKPLVTQADKASQALAQRLMARLTAAFGEGGAPAAVDVCSREAGELASTVALEFGVEIGRTSHKIRNPKNAPRDWVKPHLDAAAGRKAAQVKPVAIRLEKGAGLLKPIGVQGFCLTCHGASVDVSVREAIAARYPDDRATGFAEGDFRGFFWVEVKGK